MEIYANHITLDEVSNIRDHFEQEFQVRPNVDLPTENNRTVRFYFSNQLPGSHLPMSDVVLPSWTLRILTNDENRAGKYGVIISSDPSFGECEERGNFDDYYGAYTQLCTELDAWNTNLVEIKRHFVPFICQYVTVPPEGAVRV